MKDKFKISELLELEKAGNFQEALERVLKKTSDVQGHSSIAMLNLQLLEQRLLARLKNPRSPEPVQQLLTAERTLPNSPHSAIEPAAGYRLEKDRQEPLRDKSKGDVADAKIIICELPNIAGWKREFSQGTIKQVAFDQEYVTSIQVDRGRDFLSKEIDLLPELEYEVSFDCAGISGDPGDIFTILPPGELDGQTTINSKEAKESDRLVFYFRTGQKPVAARIRIGVGVTTSCESAAEVLIKKIEIKSRKKLSNRSFLKKSLHKYLDPELILPPLVGPGNDYEFIEVKQRELTSTAGWERLSVSVIIPVSAHVDQLSNTLMAICAQTYPKNLVEVVLVDDSNTTDINEVFSRFAKELNIYWARQQQSSSNYSRAMNLGVRASRNKILLFLDADTYIPPTYVEQMMAFHHAASNVYTFGLCHSVPELVFNTSPTNTVTSSHDSSSIKITYYSTIKSEIERLNGEFDSRLSILEETKWLKAATSPFQYCLGGLSSVAREYFVLDGGMDESLHNKVDANLEFSYRLMIKGLYFIPLQDAAGLSQSNGHAKNSVAKSKAATFELQEKCAHPAIREYVPQKLFKTPQISVYVPAYNAEKYILQAVQSVLNQSYTDYEIVIVDDGSSDNTWDVLNKEFGDNPKVRLFRKENGGIGSASNYALRQCRGYLVVQLDSDDMLTREALATVTEFFNKNPEVDCIYSKLDLITKDGATFKNGWAPSAFDRYELLVGMSVPHMRAFKRAIYNRTGGFDENIENAVDYDFYLKVSSVARIAHLPEKLYLYRIHDSQTSTAKRALQAKNHTLVVNNYLRSLGLDAFFAIKADPTDLHANYICKHNSAFTNELLKRDFVQFKLPEGVDTSPPKVTGNDYTFIQNYVAEYYKINPANYTQRVSIVIPVYNRAERLSRCLAGIFHQTYPRSLMELIVVDDGSSDDVLRVIDKYQKLFDLKYVKQADDGYRLSEARNLGIRSASYENISIIDCDLIPLPRFIESFMQYLHHFDNVVLLGHQRFVDPTGVSDDDILADVKVLDTFKDIVAENTTMKVAGKEDGPTRDWRYALYEETNILKNDEFPYRAFSSGHVAYRKQAIERAGYYDEEFNIWGCEDNEAGYRLYNQGYLFIPVLEAIDLHQEPPGGKNETNREKDRVISRELLKAKCPAVRSWFGTPYVRKPGDAPLVSICIPSYNTKEFIVEAIESALHQTEDDVEVIIYDDCSTDGTVQLIEEKYSKTPNVKLIKGSVNKNVTHARNELIKAARGEFIGFLDSDDVLEPTCIQECLIKFRGKPAIGLVCTGYSKIDENGNSLGNGWIPSNFTREGMCFGNIFTHFRMFRIRDWNRSPRWTEEDLKSIFYGEDWDLCLKLAEVCEFSRVEKPLYKYRVRNSSITRTNNMTKLAEQTLLIANKMLKRRGVAGINVYSTYPEKFPHRLCYVNLF